ncbi:winged helix-turn-helix transcriptional regulator [Shimazuella alba]|uniref:HTH hxlR-type domain-containing protein n=1 Tax=Shimazuella alba TaxID=2690964 RepID=A0A6I4VUF6_9BACL|nr:helix-turn-helix domain-containing protein [Shimazuella alba]MXQ55207.1 hypothetical protein [Shimazuella alba]
MARVSFQGEVPEEQKEVCPVTVTQNVIAGKWKIIILWHLSKQTRRFSELQRLVPGISKGILTTQLRELEKDQIGCLEVEGIFHDGRWIFWISQSDEVSSHIDSSFC